MGPISMSALTTWAHSAGCWLLLSGALALAVARACVAGRQRRTTHQFPSDGPVFDARRLCARLSTVRQLLHYTRCPIAFEEKTVHFEN